MVASVLWLEPGHHRRVSREDPRDPERRWPQIEPLRVQANPVKMPPQPSRVHASSCCHTRASELPEKLMTMTQDLADLHLRWQQQQAPVESPQAYSWRE